MALLFAKHRRHNKKSPENPPKPDIVRNLIKGLINGSLKEVRHVFRHSGTYITPTL